MPGLFMRILGTEGLMLAQQEHKMTGAISPRPATLSVYVPWLSRTISWAPDSFRLLGTYLALPPCEAQALHT